jgi:hypothetical protein
MTIKKKASRQRFLVARKIYLRPFSRNDLSYVQKWSDDPEIRKLTGEVAPMNSTKAKKVISRKGQVGKRLWNRSRPSRA